MPKYDELYPRKEPHLQMKILKSIALGGRLSQGEAAEEFQCKPSTISEAFKIMINRTKLIEITKPPPPDVEERQSKRERFYKLSAQGLLTFIKKILLHMNFGLQLSGMVLLIPNLLTEMNLIDTIIYLLKSL
jgi:hypothetical protein